MTKCDLGDTPCRGRGSVCGCPGRTSSQETPADPGCLSRRAGPASVSPPSLPDRGSSKGPGASSRVPTNGCPVMTVPCAHWVLTRTGPSAKNFTWIQPQSECLSPIPHKVRFCWINWTWAFFKALVSSQGGERCFSSLSHLIFPLALAGGWY